MRALAIARYLLVPLHPSTLLSILYFAIAMTIAEHGGVVSILLLLGSALWFFTYAFAMLDHVVEGRALPFVQSTDVIGTFAIRALGTFVLIVLCYIGTQRLQQWIDPSAVLAIRLLLLALFPIVVGGMTMTGGFFTALNPIAAFGTIARIPVGYAALILIICALWAGPLWLFHTSTFSLSSLWRMETFLPTGLLNQIGMRGAFIGFISHLVLLYLWLATFACVGGTLYEWRWELDIRPAEAPEREEERAAAELEQERDRIMDQLHAELRAGAFARVGESARKVISEGPDPIEQCRWIYARAAKFSDQRLANYLAQILIPMLLSQRATGEAVQITRQRLQVAPDFRPQTSEQLLRLVELARSAGDRTTARLLLVDFDRHFSGDPLAGRITQLQHELQG